MNKIKKMIGFVESIEKKTPEHFRLAKSLRVLVASESRINGNTEAQEMLQKVLAKQSLSSVVANAEALVNFLKEQNTVLCAPVVEEPLKKWFWTNDSCIERVVEGEPEFNMAAWKEAKAAGFGGWE
ncbi:hypothetical protein EOM81_11895 [bacterium]|nr:hypothetical protein [bacterium]